MTQLALGISIMAVPARLDHAHAMVTRLRDQVQAARKAGFHVVGPRVSLDTERLGPWWNNKTCWQMALDPDSKVTHQLVLQDDVSFCADLPLAALAAAAARPDEAIAFYCLPRGIMREAAKGGVRWVRTKALVGTVAMMLPVKVIADMLQWLDLMEPTKGDYWKRDDDIRVNAFLKAAGRSVHIGFPNLVQHLGYKGEGGIGSVLGHGGAPEKKRSAQYIGDDGLGANVSWTDRSFLKE